MSKYEEFFRAADADGSGCLDFEELLDMLSKKGYHDKDQLRAMFDSCDISGDGKITLDEYLTAMGQQPPEVHKAAAIRRVCRDFDLDGSGKIDKGELRKCLAEMGSEISEDDAARLIDTIDQDNNDVLDYDEFAKAVFGC